MAGPIAVKSPPIIHSPRAEVVESVKAQLEALSCKQFLMPSSKDDCIEKLFKYPDSVLVIDWEHGSEHVNQVLSSIKGHFLVETRPIFLLVQNLEDATLATGAEYGVSQLHAGPVDSATIKECIVALFEEEKSTKSARDGLIAVADARKRGDWTLASKLLHELLGKNPGHERVSMELAENLIHEGKFAQASELLATFVEGKPGDVPNIRGLHLAGRCQLAAGHYEAAISYLEQAKLINPHNVDRLIDLGNAFFENDQPEAAEAEFAAAETLDADNHGAKVGKGKCLLVAGEVNEALALLKMISGPREMASIFNTAAVVSMRSGRFDKGMALYKSALSAIGKEKPVAARLHFNMGLGYRRWHKPEKALACFNKSLELEPSYEKAIRHKAEVEEQVAKHPAERAATDFDGEFAEEDLRRRNLTSGSGDASKSSTTPDVQKIDEDD